jgi:hypothetical protein
MSTNAGAANALLQLYFHGVTWANVADNAAASPFTTVYVSFHTGSPAGGDQTTNEVTYTGKTRVSRSRNSTDWTITTNECKPATAITGGPATAGSETITFFGIGRSASGAGTLDFYGEVDPPIAITEGVTPELSTATVIRVI